MLFSNIFDANVRKGVKQESVRVCSIKSNAPPFVIRSPVIMRIMIKRRTRIFFLDNSSPEASSDDVLMWIQKSTILSKGDFLSFIF